MSYGKQQPLPAPSDAVLDAIGNPVRRELLRRLTSGPLTVGALAAGLPISRPAVSRHLAVLKGAALVSHQSVGTSRRYALDQTGFAAIRKWLEGFWADAEARFRLVAENTADRGAMGD